MTQSFRSSALGGTTVRRVLLIAAAAAALAALVGAAAVSAKGPGSDRLARINHVVVIYEENHSFDNLYGGWEGVNGLANADAAHTTQVDQHGVAFPCLPQNDANLSNAIPIGTPPAWSCTSPKGYTFPNGYFTIDGFIPPTAITCPPTLNAFGFTFGLRDPGINPITGATVANALPGGCTRDLVHKFYQEQYQLNGGAQNRYVVGSDAIGTSMGVYDTKALPIYRYLHSDGHPHYAIADNFFQAAFGGSFLNHQFLIAAAAPTDPAAPANLHSLVDTEGFPRSTYPLYVPLAGQTYRDSDFTVPCPAPKAGLACGNFAVNTMQPTFEPFGTFGEKLVPQSGTTIGDLLSAKGVDWAWYGGGWSNAAGLIDQPGWTNGHGPTCSDPAHDPNPAFRFPKCPDAVFQYHHQPFSYYSNFAPGTAGRAHLRDEVEFESTVASSSGACNLKAVSFVKPLGQENEHPGYASEPNGSNHLVDLLKSIAGSSCAKDTMVVVTYDEFGGEWDHVSPPGQGNSNGPHDQFGPGTRIPALIITPGLRGNFVVDHTSHDTTSILATIENRWLNGQRLGADTRDGEVADLSSVYDAHQVTGLGDD